VLAEVFFQKHDFGVETKIFLEDFLTYAVRKNGINGKNTGHANGYLGRFYFEFGCTLSCNDSKKVNFKLAKKYLKESIRLSKLNNTPKHPSTGPLEIKLQAVLKQLNGTGPIYAPGIFLGGGFEALLNAPGAPECPPECKQN
jgi:hypothetical protein